MHCRVSFLSHPLQQQRGPCRPSTLHCPLGAGSDGSGERRLPRVVSSSEPAPLTESVLQIRLFIQRIVQSNSTYRNDFYF